MQWADVVALSGIVFITLLALLAFSGVADAGTFSDCTNISYAGTWTQTASITNKAATAHCITIGANNVFIDCAGFTIDGNDTVTYDGINDLVTTTGYNNTVIKNCILSDWASGIHTYGNQLTLDNITVFSTNSNGIYKQADGRNVAEDYVNMSNVIVYGQASSGISITAGQVNATNITGVNNTVTATTAFQIVAVTGSTKNHNVTNYTATNNTENFRLGGAANPTTIWFYDSSLTGETTLSLGLKNDSVGYFINSTFNRALVNFGQATSVGGVWEKWYARLNITKSDGSAGASASVLVNDSTPTTVYTATTGATGITVPFILTNWWQNKTVNVTKNNHTFALLPVGGYTYNTTSANITVKDAMVNLSGVFAQVPGFQFSTCTNVSYAGTWNLTADIINQPATADCIKIETNGVTINCNGHTIDGNDTVTYNGITDAVVSTGYNNTVIKNCIISDWAVGIQTFGLNLTLDNLTVFSTTSLGIYKVLDTRNVTVDNVNMSNILVYDSGSSGIGLVAAFVNATNITCVNNTVALSPGFHVVSVLGSVNNHTLTNYTAINNTENIRIGSATGWTNMTVYDSVLSNEKTTSVTVKNDSIVYFINSTFNISSISYTEKTAFGGIFEQQYFRLNSSGIPFIYNVTRGDNVSKVVNGYTATGMTSPILTTIWNSTYVSNSSYTAGPRLFSNVLFTAYNGSYEVHERKDNISNSQRDMLFNISFKTNLTVCLGDSLIYGYRLDRDSQIVCKKFGDIIGTESYDIGVPGGRVYAPTTGKDAATRYPIAVAMSPEAVLITYGYNDPVDIVAATETWAQFETAFDNMLGNVSAAASKVYLTTTPTDYPQDVTVDTETSAYANIIIQKLAMTHGIRVIPLRYKFNYTNTFLLSDAVHINELGMTLWANMSKYAAHSLSGTPDGMPWSFGKINTATNWDLFSDNLTLFNYSGYFFSVTNNDVAYNWVVVQNVTNTTLYCRSCPRMNITTGNVYGNTVLYNLTFSNGTLVQQNSSATGNLTIKIETIGSHTLTIAGANDGASPIPLIAFVSQQPVDITSTNVIGWTVNVTYNATDADGINATRSNLYIQINDTTSTCLIHQNGTSVCGFTVDYHTRTNVSENWTFGAQDNEIYPATYPIDRDIMEVTTHSINTLTNANQFVKITLLNVSSTSKYGFFEVMAKGTAGTGAMPVYYCNSTYTSGQPSTNANCAQLGTIPATANYNHTHGSNSSHMVLIFAVNTTAGTINGVKITANSSFLLRGSTGSTFGYSYITNISRPNTVQTSGNNGNAWANLVGTLDAHLHQYNGSTSVCFKGEFYDVLGNGANSSETCDTLDLTPLPPTAPSVTSPIEGQITRRGDVIAIAYSDSISPNGDLLSFYNITLVDTSFAYVSTIYTNNSLNLAYNWNTAGVTPAEYRVAVKATDNKSYSSTGYSRLFSITGNATVATTISSGVVDTDDLNCSATFSDLINGTLLINFTWWNGTSHVTAFDNQSVCSNATACYTGTLVPNAQTVIGEVWRCQVQADNGTVWVSDATNSSAGTIASLGGGGGGGGGSGCSFPLTTCPDGSCKLICTVTPPTVCPASDYKCEVDNWVKGQTRGIDNAFIAGISGLGFIFFDLERSKDKKSKKKKTTYSWFSVTVVIALAYVALVWAGVV